MSLTYLVEYYIKNGRASAASPSLATYTRGGCDQNKPTASLVVRMMYKFFLPVLICSPVYVLYCSFYSMSLNAFEQKYDF